MADEKDNEIEIEIEAISKVNEVLKTLSDEIKKKVLGYFVDRIGISRKEGTVFVNQPPQPHEDRKDGNKGAQNIIKDIRTLAESKKPRSANEMAALVAYYLSEYAPNGERKDVIETEDITKYFKQAGFKLPVVPKQTLAHAKDAGYFDATSERGKYKLNPVGYNLIVHSLPSGKGEKRKTRKVISKRTSPKGKKS